jgi:hypothetical protein
MESPALGAVPLAWTLLDIDAASPPLSAAVLTWQNNILATLGLEGFSTTRFGGVMLLEDADTLVSLRPLGFSAARFGTPALTSDAVPEAVRLGTPASIGPTSRVGAPSLVSLTQLPIRPEGLRSSTVGAPAIAPILMPAGFLSGGLSPVAIGPTLLVGGFSTTQLGTPQTLTASLRPWPFCGTAFGSPTFKREAHC